MKDQMTSEEKRTIAQDKIEEKCDAAKAKLQEKRVASTSDENNIKFVSGDVNLELIRLGDFTTTLKIIGRQIVVEDATTGELYNAHDIFR